MLLSNGDGTFQAPLETAVGNVPVALVAGDFGRGQTSLAVVDFQPYPKKSLNGAVWTLVGNGDGTFQLPSFSFYVALRPVAISSGAFTANAKPDIAIANQGSKSVTVAINTAVGGIQVAPTSGAPGSFFTVSGTGFTATQTVTVQFDSVVVGFVVVDSTGSFSAQFAVPVTAKPGKHTITAQDNHDLASLTFTVQAASATVHFAPHLSGLRLW
jgi:hypothetical protein